MLTYILPRHLFNMCLYVCVHQVPKRPTNSTRHILFLSLSYDVTKLFTFFISLGPWFPDPLVIRIKSVNVPEQTKNYSFIDNAKFAYDKCNYIHSYFVNKKESLPKGNIVERNEIESADNFFRWNMIIIMSIGNCLWLNKHWIQQHQYASFELYSSEEIWMFCVFKNYIIVWRSKSRETKNKQQSRKKT